MGVGSKLKSLIVKPTTEAATHAEAKNFLNDYLLPQRQKLQQEYDDILTKGMGKQVKLDPHGKPVIDPSTGSYVYETKPVGSTVLQAKQDQIKQLDQQINSTGQQATQTAGSANDWRFTTGANVAGIGLGLGAAAYGAGAVYNGIKENTTKYQNNSKPSAPSVPQDNNGGGDQTGAIAQQQQNQQEQGQTRQDQLDNSRSTADKAYDLLNRTVESQSKLNDPDYLKRVQQDKVNAALTLSGPGDALASRQQSEANWLEASTRLDSNRGDLVRNLASLEQGERLFTMENETARQANALAYSSNIKMAEYGALGAIGAAAASGGSFQYAPVVQPTGYQYPKANIELYTKQRNPNLLRGYK